MEAVVQMFICITNVNLLCIFYHSVLVYCIFIYGPENKVLLLLLYYYYYTGPYPDYVNSKRSVCGYLNNSNRRSRLACQLNNSVNSDVERSIAKLATAGNYTVLTPKQ